MEENIQEIKKEFILNRKYKSTIVGFLFYPEWMQMMTQGLRKHR